MPANNKGSGNLSCSFCGKSQKEVKKLLGMLSGQQHAYVTWLSNLDRRIALKLGKAEE